jgi:hypothetical protein
LAPADANVKDTCSPMSLEPPVTMATLLFNTCINGFLANRRLILAPFVWNQFLEKIYFFYLF